MPKVSIIIPTYNRARYLPEAINSVIDQTYHAYEIIVIDDGSSDETHKIVDDFISKYPEKLRYYHQENRGPAAARNKGIQESKGEYISFLDSDDLWLPQKLEKSITFLERFNFDWICTASYRIKDITKGIEKDVRKIDSSFLDSSGKKLNLLQGGIFLFSEVPLYLPSILARKECFDRVGLFDEAYRIGEDTDMWLRFEEADLKGGYLDEPLFIYRTSNNNITKHSNFTNLDEHIRLAKKHSKLLGLDKKIVKKSYSDFLWHAATVYYLQKKIVKSIKYSLSSVYFDPSIVKILKILKYGVNTLKGKLLRK